MNAAKTKPNAKRNERRAVVSAQQTIPYVAMHPDGICQLPGGLYTKTVEYEDINYAVASTEDQTAIFGGWSSFLNYFDSSLPFQLSVVNRRSRSANRYKVNIPEQEDEFNSIRHEYVEMLKGQIAKSNNGIERTKYITFGLPADSVAEARPRLGRVEADVMGDLKRLGAQGLYNYCTLTSSPQPGDLVFFVGTYDTPGVSHCGLYVGDGWMLHCGDSISYANLNSSYWQSHFYAYGRLP